MRDPNESYNQGFLDALAARTARTGWQQDPDYSEGYSDGLTYESEYPILPLDF